MKCKKYLQKDISAIRSNVLSKKTAVFRTEASGFARKVCVLGMAMVLGSTLLAGCGAKKDDTPVDVTIDVSYTNPAPGNIEVEGDFIGRVEANSTISIIPKVAGDVTSINYDVGDHVEAGDLLFTIDDAAIQIQLSQAKAGLASAKAAAENARIAVDTAQLSVGTSQSGVEVATANLEATQKNLLYTQEQISQQMGTMDTNEMQLENAVFSAKLGLKSSQYSSELATEQFGLSQDSFNDLEDSLDDLKDNAKNMEKYAKGLETIYENHGKILSHADGDSEKARDYVEDKFGLSVPEDVASSAEKVANYYIYEMTDGAAYDLYALSVMKNSASNTASSMRSQRSSLDSNKDNVRFAMMSAAVNKETSKDAVISAENAKKLAEKMLEDYNNYTKAVILAGAESQMAGANAQLAAANNNLYQAQVGVAQAEYGVKRADAGAAQAQAGVTQAQAGVDAAQLQLNYTKVTAPVSGTVTQKNISLNNLASQSQPAYVIASDESQSVIFSVSETAMNVIQVGDQVHIERNGQTYEGVVTENSGVADPSNSLFKIKAQLKGGDTKLVEGTSVKISLVTQKADNVMSLPVDYIYYESHRSYVYQDVNGVAQKTYIETGINDSSNVEILSGLSYDSMIITTWDPNLMDGVPVRSVKDDSSQDTKDSSGEKQEDVAQDEAVSDNGTLITDTSLITDTAAGAALKG